MGCPKEEKKLADVVKAACERLGWCSDFLRAHRDCVGTVYFGVLGGKVYSSPGRIVDASMCFAMIDAVKMERSKK